MSAKELDQFYTNQKVAERCKESLSSVLPHLSGYKKKKIYWIEPSVGTGAFIMPGEFIGYDIDPKTDHPNVHKADFLSLIEIDHGPFAQRVVIGNPPFGKRASLAIEFVNKAALFAPTIAFIVPKQFDKWSVQSKIDKRLKLVHSEDLSEDSFIFNGKPYDVRCVFQIWTIKRTDLPDLRIKTKPKTEHDDFQMWQYNNTAGALKFLSYDYDFAVLRQGYGDYTKIWKCGERLDTKKQWILFKAKNEKVLFDLMSIDFDKLSRKNTTVPGFGKADVIEEYERIKGFAE